MFSSLSSRIWPAVAATEVRSLSHGERVGVRGYDLSMGRNPSPGSQERSDLSLRERCQNSLVPIQYSFINYILACVSGEVTAHGAVRPIVGLNLVALAGFDRTDERSRQHHLPRFERQSMGCDLVGQPGDA